MRRTVTTLLFLLGFATALVGCDQVGLDEAEPSQSVSSGQVFEDLTGFEATLADAYDGLQDVGRYGQHFMLYPDAMADNAGFIQGANRYNDVTGNLPGAHLTTYGAPYDDINLTNNIIEKIQGFQNIEAPDPQVVRDRIRGQAHFLRGLAYFDLVRTHAYEPGQEVNGFDLGVILRTQPTETPDDADFRPRSTNAEVYTQIVSDLETATTLLAGKDLSKFRANEAAAYGLLARVQLYQGNYAEAETAATNAIESAGSIGATMMSPGDFPGAWFSETLPGTLFELKMTQGQDGAATNTNESLASLSYAERAASAPASEGYRTFNFQVVPTADLVGTYQIGDARRSIIDTLSSGEIILQKYSQTLGSNTDRIPILRLAEMYLIRAEARLELGTPDTDGAQSDLDEVRTNRGLPSIGNVSGTALLDSIYMERRRELAYEGHRFFDLKRRGLDIPKPQSNVSRTVLEYDNFRVLAPFPNGQVTSNPELVQNPGY